MKQHLKISTYFCIIVLHLLLTACSSPDSVTTLVNNEGGVGPRPTPTPTPNPAPPTFSWVKGFDTSTPTLGGAKPVLNIPFEDEYYKTTITRVTHASQVTDAVAPVWVRHEYSRRPAFNSNSTYALMMSSNGWLRLYSVDNQRMNFVKTLSIGGSVEPNWHPTNPNLLYYLGLNGQRLNIRQYNVITDQTSEVRNLETRLKALFPTAVGMWTKDEGRPSQDGKIWCFQIEDAGFGALGIVSYNFETDQILGSLATTDRPDHISASPKGNYCVPSWVSNKGTRAYNLTFTNYTQLHTTSEHSDLAITKEGTEVIVYTDYSSGPNGGFVMMKNLSDANDAARLFPLYGPSHSATALHISATSKDKPGYVVVGVYGCTENYGANLCSYSTQWFNNKVFISELKANPEIYNVAHTHYANSGYWSETQAVVNNDFTKILFISSWESTQEADLSSYLVSLPSDALP